MWINISKRFKVVIIRVNLMSVLLRIKKLAKELPLGIETET
jgi:hypothetical protein